MAVSVGVGILVVVSVHATTVAFAFLYRAFHSFPLLVTLPVSSTGPVARCLQSPLGSWLKQRLNALFNLPTINKMAAVERVNSCRNIARVEHWIILFVVKLKMFFFCGERI